MTLTAILKERGGEQALLFFLVVVIGTLSVVPMGRLLYEGIAPGGTVDLSLIAKMLRAPATWRAHSSTYVYPMQRLLTNVLKTESVPRSCGDMVHK